MEIFYFLVNHLNPIVPYFIHIYCAFSFIIAGVLSIGDSKNVLDKVTILRRMNKRLFLVSVFLGYEASRCENLPYLVEQAQMADGLRMFLSVVVPCKKCCNSAHPGLLRPTVIVTDIPEPAPWP